MKAKIILSIFILIVIYLFVRLLFCYTIISCPYIFGTETYVSGSKTDFPICIMNPTKTKKVKNLISNNYHSANLIRSMNQAIDSFDYLKDEFNFDIISFENLSDIGYENTAKNLYFLLQSKNDKSKRCVICIDRYTQKILYLYD